MASPNARGNQYKNIKNSTPPLRRMLMPCLVLTQKWRGKSFIFEGEGLRIMVFQSAPPALDGPLSAPRPREEELEAEVEQATKSKPAERARYGMVVVGVFDV